MWIGGPGIWCGFGRLTASVKSTCWPWNVESSLAQISRKRREVLVLDLPPSGERDPQRIVLLGEPSDAGAELEAATAEVIERADLPRPQQRMAQRDEGDRGADPQRRGVQGEGLAREQRIEQRRPPADRQLRRRRRSGFRRIRVYGLEASEEHDVLGDPHEWNPTASAAWAKSRAYAGPNFADPSNACTNPISRTVIGGHGTAPSCIVRSLEDSLGSLVHPDVVRRV